MTQAGWKEKKRDETNDPKSETRVILCECVHMHVTENAYHCQ